MAKKRKIPSTSSLNKGKKKSRVQRIKKIPKVVTPELVEESFDPKGSESFDQEFDAKEDNQTSATNEAASKELVESGFPAVGTGTDPLRQYLRDVSRYPLLAPEEELKLVKRLVEEGDVQAARRLVTANLRLVVKIAMEYKNAYQNVMDLIQEGNVGLMKAVSKYDPTRGAKLSYYATWWIRSYILKYILDNFRLVKIGTTQAQKKLFFHLMREKEKLQAQGLEYGPKLLADKLNVREKDVVEMDQRLSAAGNEMSLDKPLVEEGGGRSTFLDYLESEGASPDDVLAAAELKHILTEGVEKFTETLDEKERVVFLSRMLSENPQTLQAVADQFSLTRERVRQIEQKVIEKLKNYYDEHLR